MVNRQSYNRECSAIEGKDNLIEIRRVGIRTDRRKHPGTCIISVNRGELYNGCLQVGWVCNKHYPQDEPIGLTRFIAGPVN
ncbi:hypothetical protein D9M71_71670 [compost metagenome]